MQESCLFFFLSFFNLVMKVQMFAEMWGSYKDKEGYGVENAIKIVSEEMKFNDEDERVLLLGFQCFLLNLSLFTVFLQILYFQMISFHW